MLKQKTKVAKAKLAKIQELADKLKKECTEGDYAQAFSTYAEIGVVLSERVNRDLAEAWK